MNKKGYIGFFEVEDWERPVIQSALKGEKLFITNDKAESISEKDRKKFEIVSTFVHSTFNREMLKNFPNLKCVTTRSTGYDHIDLRAAKDLGISVLYVPGYGDNTVAEYTFGLILNLSRKIYLGVDRIKETGTFSIQGLRGVDLYGKTLGVIGTGRIGKQVIRIGKGFGMRIIAHDTFPDLEYARANGFEYLSLNAVMEASDFLTIHCPYNNETHHLINKKNISRIKRGAYLINTARGGVVETDAIILALEKGILAGAGLDVLEEEGETREELEFIAGHPKERDLKVVLENNILMKMPNVLITPHNAFNSEEALRRILDITIQNIKSFIKGAPINVVS